MVDDGEKVVQLVSSKSEKFVLINNSAQYYNVQGSIIDRTVDKNVMRLKFSTSSNPWNGKTFFVLLSIFFIFVKNNYLSKSLSGRDR